jgi:hypothetical protein
MSSYNGVKQQNSSHFTCSDGGMLVFSTYQALANKSHKGARPTLKPFS